MNLAAKWVLVGVTGLVVAGGLLRVVTSGESSDSNGPSESEFAEPASEQRAPPAVAVPAPTLSVSKHGTRIALLDPARALVRTWDMERNEFSSAAPAASVLNDSSVPLKASRGLHSRWLMIEESGASGRETSVVSTNRDRKGWLVPVALRIWDTRAELAWDHTRASSWTLQKNGAKPFKVTGGKYVDPDQGSATSVRYTLTGRVASQKVGGDRIGEYTYVLIVPSPPGERVNASKDISQTWSEHLRLDPRSAATPHHRDGPRHSDPDDVMPKSTPKSSSGSWASMHRSEQGACRALTDHPPVGAVLGQSLDERDLDQIQALFDTPGVRMVADGRCGDIAVIKVGVSASGARMPAVADNGTPIVMFYQRLFKAL